MLSQHIQEQLADRYGGTPVVGILKKAFDERLVEALQQGDVGDGEAHSAVMFVDIANFSARVAGMYASEIRSFLDSYYTVAIPEIYKKKGHIDRIVGDGIVAVFSSFLPGGVDDREADLLALRAAEVIVRRLHKSDHTSKAAISFGDLLYCRTGLANLYQDYTVIGEPLTVAYRIEEVAEAGQVVLPTASQAGAHVAGELANRQEQLSRGAALPRPQWTVITKVSELRGIGPLELTVQTCTG